MKLGWTAARLCAAVALAGGVLASAQQLPIEPPKQFGTSITGAFEGWFDNPDGSHSFLVGYLNRNRAQELDVPIGPNNLMEPGGPDRHFCRPVEAMSIDHASISKGLPPSEAVQST